MADDRTIADVRAPLERSRRSRFGDVFMRRLTAVAGAGLAVLLLVIVITLVTGGTKALTAFGFGFLTRKDWIPTQQIFGGLAFIYGTLVTSAIGILLAVPIAVGLALFVTEVCPKPLRAPLAALSDMLAAIPSVVYGLWGIFVMLPWLDRTAEPALKASVGRIPVIGALFHGNTAGGDFFSAGVILGVMILPIISSIAREILSTVPRDLKDGAYALGATRYEVIRGVTLPYARAGLVGASMLGLGRALGETIAVTMVIGNSVSVSASLFHGGFTIPSWIASTFNEATNIGLERASLLYLALLLVVISFGFAALARLLVRRTRQQTRGRLVPQGAR